MSKKESDRRWRVVYDLAYDFGGSGEWNGYYRTLMGARIAKWWNLHISAWGGTALLIDQDQFSGKGK